MPTPFTHLDIANRLRADARLPSPLRDLITAHWPAFLLGSVAPDARVSSEVGREATHFYHYNTPITEHPWRIMLHQFPELQQTHSPDQRAFLAGYVAHLAVDTAWSQQMVGPHFVLDDWGGVAPEKRYLSLTLLLIVMDERDLLRIRGTGVEALRQARPWGWLPFLPDSVLEEWRGVISRQLAAGAASETLDIIGGRIGMAPEDLRSRLDSADGMQKRLWDHISPELLGDIEAQVYHHTMQQVVIYWSAFS
jgi:hypothetical protein